MPVKISELREREVRKIAIDVGEGDFINLEYFPNKMSLNLSEKIKEATEVEDEREVVSIFFSVVKSWDLQDDEGELLPMTDETIGDLGVEILGTILMRLKSADSPKEQTSTT